MFIACLPAGWGIAAFHCGHGLPRLDLVSINIDDPPHRAVTLIDLPDGLVRSARFN
jgi:hypothetical protein